MARITFTASPMLGDQEIHFSASDAVFFGAGAIERQRPMNEAVIETFSFRHFFGFVRIDHEPDVKIAVSGMTNDGGR